MLLLSLIAFGLAGIISRYLVGSKMPVILLLSAGSIALINPASLFFCLFISVINFFLLKVATKKTVFGFSLLFNVLVLSGFHFYEIIYKEFYWSGIPVLAGVSFLSLQHIDYLCKIYFKQSQKPKNFLSYLTTVLYFPKFFSGPVASLPEIEKQINLSVEKFRPVSYGLNRILVGLFKKLVLAESLAPVVHSVFDFNDVYPGLTFLTAAFLYSLQLYFDFSGYSDMAVGISSLWGINLPENFNFPFRQKSWGNFWKSWHSSLTNWLWQYIFNPLYLFFGRKNLNKKVISLLCTFCVFAAMAFFNGIQSGFYISAGIFAFFYFIEIILQSKKTFLSGALVFILFSVGLIYFRCPANITYIAITERLKDYAHFIPSDWLTGFFAPLASGGSQQDYFNLFISLALCILFLIFEKIIFALFSQNKINYTAWFIMIVLLLSWGVFENGERFIYMQF
ncbi:MAG TPA: MBOAT family O-acyltransferase [Bacteroidia bacterium]|jgi:alginate O-acetyltransferase complex protein AlgI|nr:MBOAT family O-acyltransferase [Bacteroidia bacterium]